MSAAPTYRLGRHPRRTDHPALLHLDGTVAHTFAYDATPEQIAGSLAHAGLMLHADNTVTADGDPAKEDGEIAASRAACGVLAGAQDVLALGRQVAAAEIAYNAYDSVSLKACGGARGSDNEDAHRILYDRQEALRALISTTPARSLADAAVLVSESLTIASRLAESNFSKPVMEEYLARLERMLFSATPFIAEAAGLDMEAMDWADRDTLRPVRFEGVGVQS